MSQSSLSHLVVTAGQFHAAGRLDEAQALYESVLAQDPGRTDAQWGLGLLAFQKSRYADAIRLLKWDAVSKSGDPLLCTALAASLLAIPDPSPPKAAQAAAIAARRALDFDPNFPDAYNNLACALLILGRTEDALAMFRAALNRRPDYPEAHFNLGRTYHELNDLPAAIAAYRAALAARPDYPAAQISLDLALQGMEG